MIRSRLWPGHQCQSGPARLGGGARVNYRPASDLLADERWRRRPADSISHTALCRVSLSLLRCRLGWRPGRRTLNLLPAHSCIVIICLRKLITESRNLGNVHVRTSVLFLDHLSLGSALTVLKAHVETLSQIRYGLNVERSYLYRDVSPVEIYRHLCLTRRMTCYPNPLASRFFQA